MTHHDTDTQSDASSEESSVTTKQYQVQVWATTEFTPTVTATDEEEARGQAASRVKMEQGLTDDDIKSVKARQSARDADEDDVWYGEVWASKEYVVRVEASGEDDAEHEAVEKAKAVHGLVDSDISSVHVEDSREVEA